MPKKRDEHTTAQEALLGKETGKVNYGGEEYVIKTLTLDQILQILRLLGGEMAIMKAYADEGSDQLEMFGAFIRLLKEQKLYILISIILGISEKQAEEGYRTVDALRILRLAAKLEEVDTLFLEVSALAKEIKMFDKIPESEVLRDARKEAKKAHESTPSSSE